MSFNAETIGSQITGLERFGHFIQIACRLWGKGSGVERKKHAESSRFGDWFDPAGCLAILLTLWLEVNAAHRGRRSEDFYEFVRGQLLVRKIMDRRLSCAGWRNRNTECPGEKNGENRGLSGSHSLP